MSNKIKVVFMLTSPLTSRWENYFCMDDLSKIFDLEYWDFSPIASLPFEANDILERDYVKVISSFTMLKKALKSLPMDVVCMAHVHLDDVRNYKLHKIISSYCPNRVGLNIWYNASSQKIDLEKGNVIDDKVENKSVREKNVFYRVKTKLYQIYPLQYVAKFLMHRKDGQFDSWKKHHEILRIIDMYNHYSISILPGSEYYINQPDYERYLQIEKMNEKPLTHDKYVVYLDQYFLYHPTVALVNPNVDIPSLREPFFCALNAYFDKVEKMLNCKVVIAAHPVANYKTNPFNGREIFYFKTAELIRDCEAVILHSSSSISFAVLYDKPVSIVSNEQIEKLPNFLEQINVYGKVFHLPVVNIDKIDKRDPLFVKISPSVRKGYMDTFYDTTYNKTNSELLAEHIVNIHEQIIASSLNSGYEMH